jgi:hypothetical protein
MKLQDLPTVVRVRQAGALDVEPARLLAEVAFNPYREGPLLAALAAAERLADAPLHALIARRRCFGYGRLGGTMPRGVQKAA